MQHPHPKFYCMLFRFPPPAFPAVCAAVTPAYHARVCMIAHGGLNVFLVLGMHAALRFVLVSTAVQASGPATAFSSSAVDLKRLSLADRQGQVRAPAQLRLMTRTGLRLAQRKAETGAVQGQAHDFPTPSRVPPHHYTPTTTHSHVCALLASCPRAVPLTVLAGCGTQVQLTLRRVGTFAGQGSGFQRNRMFSAYLMPGNSPVCPPAAIKPRARVEPPCPGGHPLPGIDPGLNPGSPGIIPRIFDPGLIPG